MKADQPVDPLAWLDAEWADWTARGLERRLTPRRPHGCESSLLDFSSNDYLGLSDDPRVIDAAIEATRRFGTGARASALVSGWTEEHEALAADLAAFEGVEAVALAPTGYAANLGAIASVVGSGDAVYVDRLNHACLMDGVRLSGAALRVVPHNDVTRLAEILTRDEGRYRRRLIAVDGVFSMDGDLAPLPKVCALAERHGAMTLVDEAHGTGLFGRGGRGAREYWDVMERVTITVGTLSKALGTLGGFVAGERRLVRYVVQRAGPLVYSTALPPACAAAARAALAIVQAEPERRIKVFALAERLRHEARRAGWVVPESLGPIVPILVGEADATMRLAQELKTKGVVVGAIRPPTVPRGTARLRVSLSARHSIEAVDRLIETLRQAAIPKIGALQEPNQRRTT